MPCPIRIWQPDAFSPAAVLAVSDELVLDRELLGEATVSRVAQKAPRMVPIGDSAVRLSIPSDCTSPVLVFEGVGFAFLQAGIPPAREQWKVGPGQLGDPSRLAVGKGTSLAFLRQLDWERPGPAHHLLLLPKARAIAAGQEELIRAPALVIIGNGAIELCADITRGSADDVRPMEKAFSVEIPDHPYHTGLAPLLDQFPKHEASGKLALPRHDAALGTGDLAATCGGVLSAEKMHSGFFPILEDDRVLRLAFAYTRADGSTGVLLSDPEIRGWLSELGAVLRSRVAPTVSALPARPPVGDPLASFGGISTRSRVFAKVLEHVAIIAPGEADLILLGPTGTGKERLARAIHAASARSGGPFVAVNCAGQTKELLHGNLFGHVKGAFTGADGARKGQFLAADGGTLLLDEIADSLPEFQQALLRVLETRRILPLGTEKETPVDVRVLAATSKPLTKLKDEGRFSVDLYYRLMGGEVTVPPLRERMEDIPALCLELLQSFGVDAVPSQKALGLLMTYAWEGNVRELGKVLSAAVQKARVRLASARGGSEPGGSAEPLRVLDATDFDFSHAETWLPRSRAGVVCHFDGATKKLGHQIWQEQALPATGTEQQYRRRALQRAALLYLDSERPRADWPGAVTACWNQLFRPGWAKTEKGRGLKDLLGVLSVRMDDETAVAKASEWVFERVGTEDAPADPKKPDPKKTRR